MSILKPVGVEDPFASLAWSACVATLALEKMSTRRPIDDEERSALSKVLDLVEATSRAHRLTFEELLATGQDVTSPLVIASFSALAGMTRHHDRPIELDQTVEDLRNIITQLGSACEAKIDRKLLKRAQDACQTLLESINLQRASPQQPAYIES